MLLLGLTSLNPSICFRAASVTKKPTFNRLLPRQSGSQSSVVQVGSNWTSEYVQWMAVAAKKKKKQVMGEKTFQSFYPHIMWFFR